MKKKYAIAMAIIFVAILVTVIACGFAYCLPTKAKQIALELYCIKYDADIDDLDYEIDTYFGYGVKQTDYARGKDGHWTKGQYVTGTLTVDGVDYYWYVEFVDNEVTTANVMPFNR